jgi:hypothetical protein
LIQITALTRVIWKKVVEKTAANILIRAFPVVVVPVIFHRVPVVRLIPALAGVEASAPVMGCLGLVVQLIPVTVLKKVGQVSFQVVLVAPRIFGRGLPVVGFRLIQAGVSAAGGRNGPVTVCQFSPLSPASLTTLCLRSRVKVRLRLIRLRARSGRRCLLVFQVVRQLLLWRFPASAIVMS